MLYLLGDHDLTENIIHPVLARIEGTRRGRKGISIFIVPKIRVNDGVWGTTMLSPKHRAQDGDQSVGHGNAELRKTATASASFSVRNGPG